MELTNAQRAGFARTTLRHYNKIVRGEMETAPVDLLSDLMHYCGQKGLDFDALVDSARNHYHDEKAGV
jgi:hypothetical protein